jgi:hypothetical protein
MADYLLEILEDKKGEFRWRRKTADGTVLASSPKGFQNRRTCVLDESKSFVIGWKQSASISRVEGMCLTDEMDSKFLAFSAAETKAEDRRAILMKRYGSK